MVVISPGKLVYKREKIVAELKLGTIVEDYPLLNVLQPPTRTAVLRLSDITQEIFQFWFSGTTDIFGFHS